ncbi:MAG: hypothetical protein ACPGUD_02955 [Parashewanella sp.]
MAATSVPIQTNLVYQKTDPDSLNDVADIEEQDLVKSKPEAVPNVLKNIPSEQYVTELKQKIPSKQYVTELEQKIQELTSLITEIEKTIQKQKPSNLRTEKEKEKEKEKEQTQIKPKRTTLETAFQAVEIMLEDMKKALQKNLDELQQIGQQKIELANLQLKIKKQEQEEQALAAKQKFEHECQLARAQAKCKYETASQNSHQQQPLKSAAQLRTEPVVSKKESTLVATQMQTELVPVSSPVQETDINYDSSPFPQQPALEPKFVISCQSEDEYPCLRLPACSQVLLPSSDQAPFISERMQQRIQEQQIESKEMPLNQSRRQPKPITSLGSITEKSEHDSDQEDISLKKEPVEQDRVPSVSPPLQKASLPLKKDVPDHQEVEVRIPNPAAPNLECTSVMVVNTTETRSNPTPATALLTVSLPSAAPPVEQAELSNQRKTNTHGFSHQQLQQSKSTVVRMNNQRIARFRDPDNNPDGDSPITAPSTFSGAGYSLAAPSKAQGQAMENQPKSAKDQRILNLKAVSARLSTK